MEHTDDSFLSLVPKGWILEYLKEMRAASNEMPMAFHFLSACVIIGQILGLEAWATLAKGVSVFPNVNALLLSPAGKCRRGEGTKITVGVAKRAGVHTLEGKTTPEALLDELQESGNTLLYVEELSMLLTKQEFQRPLIPILTKLLLHGRGPVDMRTRGLGRQAVPFVNLSALFTSAPDWFMQTIPDEAFGGGMMSRFLVCCLDEREIFHIDINAEDEKDAGMMEKLAEELREVEKCRVGRVRGTKEAQQWIVQWYMENETEAIVDDRLLPHRNRKPANLLRLAMILGASCGEMVLTKDRLEQTLAILDWFEPTLAHLYGITEEVSSRMARGEKRVTRKLAGAGKKGMTHAQLARACLSYFNNGAREMRHCLEGLLEKGLVAAHYKIDIDRERKRYPPHKWTLAKEASNDEAGKEVAEE